MRSRGTRVLQTLAVYALLKKPAQLSTETRTEFEKYVQLMEKSLAAANGKLNWPKDEKIAVEVLETAVKLAEDRLELARFINSETSVKEVLHSFHRFFSAIYVSGLRQSSSLSSWNSDASRQGFWSPSGRRTSATPHGTRQCRQKHSGDCRHLIFVCYSVIFPVFINFLLFVVVFN